MLGLVTTGCDDSGHARLINTASSIDTTAIISPSPIVLAPITNVPCATGRNFDSSFNLIVTAGVTPLTLDSVTIQMLDGTNLGGPSVTIPHQQIAPSAGTSLIPARTTRSFALSPSFGCIVNTPQSFRASALLVDTRGIKQTVRVAGAVR
jgi:hypothetical protein